MGKFKPRINEQYLIFKSKYIAKWYFIEDNHLNVKNVTSLNLKQVHFHHQSSQGHSHSPINSFVMAITSIAGQSRPKNKLIIKTGPGNFNYLSFISLTSTENMTGNAEESTPMVTSHQLDLQLVVLVTSTNGPSRGCRVCTVHFS